MTLLGLAAGAIERVVDMFGAATFERGDDEADIEAERGLDARDNPAAVGTGSIAPALGRIAGLGIAAQDRQPAGGTVDADRIGGSDNDGVGVQRPVAGQPEPLIDRVGPHHAMISGRP